MLYAPWEVEVCSGLKQVDKKLGYFSEIQVYCYWIINNTFTFLYKVKPVFDGHSNERTPSDQGTHHHSCVLSSHIEEPVIKRHLSCCDTFFRIFKCALKKDSFHCTLYIIK